MKPTLTFIVNQGAGTGRPARLWGKVKQILDEHDILYEASASGIPKWKTFLCLPFLVAAKHERIRGFAVTDVEKVVLKSDKPMVLHADGEYCGDVTKAEFACLKGKLKLLR